METTTKIQTPEEVLEELQNTDKDKLIEYIFNQAGIIGRQNEEAIRLRSELEDSNKNKEYYITLAAGLQAKLDTLRASVTEVFEIDERPAFSNYASGDEWLSEDLIKRGLKEEETPNE